MIAPAWVGDLVMSQTLFKLLRDKYGNALILDVFASGFLAGLIARMPEVNEIIVNPFLHGKFELMKRIRVGLNLRSKHYDEVFILPNSFKSAITPFFAGIKRRTAFVGEFRYALLNNIYKLDKEKLPLMIDRFCALANNGNKVAAIKWPELTVNLANQKKILEKFQLNPNKPIIAFCPAAEYGPAKRWPTNHFAKLANLLLERGYQIMILGSNKDTEISKEIIKLANKPSDDVLHHNDYTPRESIKAVGLGARFTTVKNSLAIFDLCGKTVLADTIDLLAGSSYVVTNDSGLMHIACAVQSQVIAVYGSTSPGFTPPLNDKAQILQIKLECSPCFQRTCRFGHYNCLKYITPEMVLAQII